MKKIKKLTVYEEFSDTMSTNRTTPNKPLTPHVTPLGKAAKEFGETFKNENGMYSYNQILIQLEKFASEQLRIKVDKLKTVQQSNEIALLDRLSEANKEISNLKARIPHQFIGGIFSTSATICTVCGKEKYLH